jgi:hypothetical protein
MFGYRWHALLLTRSVNTRLALCHAWGGAPWDYWSAVHCDGRETCSWSRLTTLLLGDCWEPESWSSWFPLKSSPTCSVGGYVATYRTYHTNCTAGMYALASLRHLADCGIFHVCFSDLLSGGEVPYARLSGLPRRHLFRPFLYNHILVLPPICVVTKVTPLRTVTEVTTHIRGNAKIRLFLNETTYWMILPITKKTGMSLWNNLLVTTSEISFYKSWMCIGHCKRLPIQSQYISPYIHKLCKSYIKLFPCLISAAPGMPFKSSLVQATEIKLT